MAINRPSWNEYFLGLAFVIAQRSLDPRTKHGSVVTDDNNHIVATGFNSFPHKFNDFCLPTTPPEKYKWMVHSERNALANCTVNLWLLSKGGTLYITGTPCLDCAIALWQHNVKRWYVAIRQGTRLENDKTKADFDTFLRHSEIQINYIDINLDWIKNIQI